MTICRKISRRMMLAFSGAAILASSASAFAAETLKFGHVYEASSPYHEAALRAADAFEEATNGQFTIEVFPASQLGNEAALNEALSLGTVDLIYTGPSFMSSSYGPLAVSEFPYTLRGFDHWKAYSESDLFAELSQAYKDVTGNHVAALTYYGARHVTSNKPILTPEDMKNLKIRTPNAPAFQLFPEVTGANPTPMAFAEVYLALQQGVVDAQENPLPTIQFKKFYEVQSNINLTGHIINSLASVISPTAQQKLGDKLPILIDILKQEALWASFEIRKSEALLADWFRDQGVTVNEVNILPFMEVVRPHLIKDGMPWDRETFERLQQLDG